MNAPTPINAPTSAPLPAPTIAFQGEPGAFSEEAALNLLGPNAAPVPRPTFDSLFAAIHEGAADCILAPIENSLAGTVAPVCDLLWDSNLSIIAEAIHPIRHCLIGAPGATLQTVQTVQSHPVALAQCRNYFRMHPHVRRVAAEDTAGSVREVVRSADPTRAAIASARAAQINGGTILLEGLEDDPSNFTRFLLLAPDPERPIALPKADAARERKLTLLLRLRHQAGSLHRALGVFARRSMSLLKIESRPLIGQPWHYRFFLDVAAHRDPHQNEAALADLCLETDEVRVLGIYPAAAVAPSLRPSRSASCSGSIGEAE